MNFKKELMFGLIGLLVLIGLIAYFLTTYSSPKPNTENVKTNQQQSTPTNQKIIQKEVSKHNIPQDCWIIVAKKVYDVTQFLDLHPGGADKIIPYCGSDATEAFRTQGGEGSHSNEAKEKLETYYLGNYE